jgi:UMF1 family MFS transporter
MVYNDAIITVIFFGGQYATDQFKFETGKLFLFAIILNVFAGIGAFLLGFLDDILGGKKTIQITNFGFVVACLIAFLAPLFVYGESLFWLAGCLIGIFMGPNQASSRSLMGRLIFQSNNLLSKKETRRIQTAELKTQLSMQQQIQN